MPQVRFLNLGLGVDVLFVGFAMPAGLKRYYGKGHLLARCLLAGVGACGALHAWDVFAEGGSQGD